MIGRAASLAAVLVFFQVPSAFAVPTAEWGGPWQVTPGLSLTTIGDSEDARRAFGRDATKDGQILNQGSFFEPLPGTVAVAKAYGKVEAGGCIVVCNHFFADTSIQFDRAFRLSGSPSGLWDVDLLGALTGKISALGVDMNPKAQVGASVTIATLSHPDVTLKGRDSPVEFSHVVTVFTPDISGSEIKLDRHLLVDGTYLVHGSLNLNTDAFEVRCGFFCDDGSAVVDFFNGPNAGLLAEVAAAPVPTPEPGTIMLFGTTAAGIGLAARWRRRRGN